MEIFISLWFPTCYFPEPGAAATASMGDSLFISLLVADGIGLVGCARQLIVKVQIIRPEFMGGAITGRRGGTIFLGTTNNK